MTWSYTPADLGSSEKDQVRLLIADTDTTAQLLQDEEIEFNLTQEANVWGAAARSCEQISRNFLRKADVRIGRGGTTLTYSTAANQYQEMAVAFRKRANAMHAPWAGGTSLSAKDELAQNSDAVQPIFTKTMENNSFVGGETSDTPLNDGQTQQG